jgi:ATP-binding cassette subfamily B protein
VFFSCDKEKEIEALSGVSFTAKQGEITAIVGPSGGIEHGEGDGSFR